MTLLDVFEVSSLIDVLKGTDTQAEALCDLSLRETRRAQAPYFNDIISSEIGFGTPLPRAVIHVVLVSSKEQMARIATNPVVAPMTDEESIGNLTIGDFPSQPMGLSSDMPSIHHECDMAVSKSGWSLRPRPTLIVSSDNDVSSDTCNKRFIHLEMFSCGGFLCVQQ